MIEFRIHGRGGQGSVAAAYLLAGAAFNAGYMCQAFPAFGAERRGAPVVAFVRIDKDPIELRAQVRTPDFLVVQDDTLLIDPKITAGLRDGGAMLVNSRRSGTEVAEHFGCRAVCIDATAMALETLGKPIPNTAILAALLALTRLIPQDALAEAVRGRFAGDVLKGNLALLEVAAAAVPAGAWAREAEDA